MSSKIDRYETTYTDKWSGNNTIHVNKNSESDASGWGKSLAAENNCKSVTEAVHTDGTRKHIVSYGDKH